MAEPPGCLSGFTLIVFAGLCCDRRDERIGAGVDAETRKLCRWNSRHDGDGRGLDDRRGISLDPCQTNFRKRDLGGGELNRAPTRLEVTARMHAQNVRTIRKLAKRIATA